MGVTPSTSTSGDFPPCSINGLLIRRQVRRFLPELIQLIWDRKINPGKVFDLTPPLEDAAKATGLWISGAPSRSCSSRDPYEKHTVTPMIDRLDTPA